MHEEFQKSNIYEVYRKVVSDACSKAELITPKSPKSMFPFHASAKGVTII